MKLIFCLIAILGAMLWGIDHSTGILTEEHLENREAMAKKHGPGHPIYEQLVQELITNTTAPEHWRRKMAATDLGQLGNGAARAVPYLKHLLKDKAADIRYEAATALVKIKTANSQTSANS